MMERKTAEAADFDPLATRQRVANLFEQAFYRRLGHVFIQIFESGSQTLTEF